LFTGARSVRGYKASATVSSQIRNYASPPSRGNGISNFVVGVDIVRKPMEEDGYRALGWADVQILDVDYTCLDLFHWVCLLRQMTL
jgi:hypothetical protein